VFGAGNFARRDALVFWRPDTDGSWPWLEMWVTTRLGGTSPEPFASLNLGAATGDAPAHVEANRALVRRSLQLEHLPLHRLRQVHGDRVLRAGDAAEPEADGLWTDTPGEVLVVGVADCVPVFLWDTAGRRLALVHAGWRGTAAGIVARSIERLGARGTAPSDLHVALGPSIGPCCYAVGPEVAAALPDAVRPTPAGQTHLDLRDANRRQALALGVPAAHIFATPPCTACDGTHFFSHRKLGPRTGRHWALAWMTQAGPGTPQAGAGGTGWRSTR